MAVGEAYRYVSRWEAHQVEEHCVHDSTHLRRRFGVAHGRLWESWVEQNPVGGELIEDSLSQFNAFLDVNFSLRVRNQSAGGVERKEEESVESVIGTTDY